MERYTQVDKVNEAAERWKEQYYDQATGKWDKVKLGPSNYVETREKVYEELKGLPVCTLTNLTKLEGEMHAIIGNSSWSTIRCSVCRQDTYQCIRHYFYSGKPAQYICYNCMRKAVGLFK